MGVILFTCDDLGCQHHCLSLMWFYMKVLEEDFPGRWIHIHGSFQHLSLLFLRKLHIEHTGRHPWKNVLTLIKHALPATPQKYKNINKLHDSHLGGLF